MVWIENILNLLMLCKCKNKRLTKCENDIFPSLYVAKVAAIQSEYKDSVIDETN